MVPPPGWFVPPVELAAADSAARTDAGFAVVGLTSTVSVLAAAFIAMIVCRSCSSAATEPLWPRLSIDAKRLFAPVPFGAVSSEATTTMATSTAATATADRVTPVRRNTPRFLRALRDLLVRRGPVALGGPLKLRDSIGSTAEFREPPSAATLCSSSIAVRCRDNPVPSGSCRVCAAPMCAAGPRCQKETSGAPTSQERHSACRRRLALRNRQGMRHNCPRAARDDQFLGGQHDHEAIFPLAHRHRIAITSSSYQTHIKHVSRHATLSRPTQVTPSGNPVQRRGCACKQGIGPDDRGHRGLERHRQCDSSACADKGMPGTGWTAARSTILGGSSGVLGGSLC